MKRIFQFVYLSEGVDDFSDAQIEQLLTHARASNSRLGLTGYLYVNAGHFLQLIEGPEVNVRMLFSKISVDSRHTKIKVLYEGVSDSRLFADWNMGYKKIHEYDMDLRDRIEDFVASNSRSETFLHSEDSLELFEFMKGE
jgi:hypothetical protein